MPLILAIVADPQQAAQLAKLIQGRLSVDLVHAAEVGEGLLALEDRVPDLVLTSPFMSPFDDGVLDEYLRSLGPAGTHVQSVRIPVLSDAPKKKQRLGFSLLRSKPEPVTPEGCEPKVFADEIAHYLERAAEEKRHAESNESSPVMAVEESTPTPQIEEHWTPAYEEATPVYSSEATPVYRPYSPSEQATWSTEPELDQAEPEPHHAAWRSDLLDRPPDDEAAPYSANTNETTVHWQEQHKPIELGPPAAVIEAASSVAPAESLDEPLEVLPIQEPEIAAEATVEEARFQETVVEATVAAEPVVEEAIFEEAIVEAVTVDEAVVQDACLPTESPVAAIEQVDVREHDTVLHAATEDVVADSSRPIEIAQDVVSSPSQPTGPDPRAIKATPSFKAALAAIRAAWGKPTRTTRQDNVASVDEQPTSNRIVSPEIANRPETPSVAAIAEVTPPVEVDLTGAVDMLDGPQPESTLVPAPPQPPPSAEMRQDSLGTDDVYELSVDPEMPELEAKLLAPLAPAPRRQAATQVEGETSTSTRRDESTNRRHTKKKRGSKGAKAKAARSEQQADTQDVQDEWGMFDPNRCGFAAVVNKLDEVAEKKEQQPQRGNKVRLISYS